MTDDELEALRRKAAELNPDIDPQVVLDALGHFAALVDLCPEEHESGQHEAFFVAVTALLMRAATMIDRMPRARLSKMANALLHVQDKQMEAAMGSKGGH